MSQDAFLEESELEGCLCVVTQVVVVAHKAHLGQFPDDSGHVLITSQRDILQLYNALAVMVAVVGAMQKRIAAPGQRGSVTAGHSPGTGRSS